VGRTGAIGGTEPRQGSLPFGQERPGPAALLRFGPLGGPDLERGDVGQQMIDVPAARTCSIEVSAHPAAQATGAAGAADVGIPARLKRELSQSADRYPACRPAPEQERVGAGV
jgi:hypothetical protein